jgi:hypothetical protein
MAFQNIVGKLLGQGAITTVYTIFYTVPTNTRTYIKDIDICNTTSTTINVYLSLVIAGETPGTTNSVMYNVPIPGYTTVQWCGTQILNEAGTVQMKATAAGCSVTISGGEAT